MRLRKLNTTQVAVWLFLISLFPISCTANESINIGNVALEIGMAKDDIFDKLNSYKLQNTSSDQWYVTENAITGDPSKYERWLIEFQNEKLVRADKMFPAIHSCDAIKASEIFHSIISSISDKGLHNAEIKALTRNVAGTEFKNISMWFGQFLITIGLVKTDKGGIITITEALMHPDYYMRVYKDLK